MIREAILEGEIENSFEAAYQFMVEKAAGMGLEPVRRMTGDSSL